MIYCYECEASTPLMGNDEAEELFAYLSGWQIGHFNGQSYYSCHDCSVGLFDPIQLKPTWFDEATTEKLKELMIVIIDYWNKEKS